MKKHDYVVEKYYTGAVWKSFVDGVDYLDDRTVYKLTWHIHCTILEYLNARIGLFLKRKGQRFELRES